MDILLAHILERFHELEERGCSYDVFCIYIRNLLARFEKDYPHLVDAVKDLYCYIPTFHAHAHRDQCQVVYGFKYTEHGAEQHGEFVEQPWSFVNIAGLVTREMMHGAREDSLNDLFNFWNRRKIETLGEYVRMPRASTG